MMEIIPAHDIDDGLRWRRRYERFAEALEGLRKGIDRGVENLNELEQDGVVARFVGTFELAWLTLADYLWFMGVQLWEETPEEAIRQAYAAQILRDQGVWLEMLGAHRQLSVVRDPGGVGPVIEHIGQWYVGVMEDFQAYLQEQLKLD